MPAYFIALNRCVRDRQRLEQYWRAVGPTFQDTGAKSLAIYTPLTVLEELGSLEGAVVIEFPDVLAAKAWYDSPTYQEVRQHRIGAADVEAFIIEGGALPAEDRMPQTINQQS